MPVPRNTSLNPRATRTTVTVKNASALQLAIDFYYANRDTITIELHPRKNRSPSRIKKTGISIRRVAAMHSISYSQLQRTIAAGGELHTRSEAHEAEMVLTIAEEAALEEWCLVMYRWGGISCPARYFQKHGCDNLRRSRAAEHRKRTRLVQANYGS